MHICVSKLTGIGSDNGLLPGRCQAAVWTYVGILLIGPLGTNHNPYIFIKENAFENVVAAILSQPQCVKIWTIYVPKIDLHRHLGHHFISVICNRTWNPFHLLGKQVCVMSANMEYIYVRDTEVLLNVYNNVLVWLVAHIFRANNYIEMFKKIYIWVNILGVCS